MTVLTMENKKVIKNRRVKEPVLIFISIKLIYQEKSALFKFQSRVNPKNPHPLWNLYIQRTPDFNSLATLPVIGRSAIIPNPCFLPREPSTPLSLIGGNDAGGSSPFQRFFKTSAIWTACPSASCALGA